MYEIIERKCIVFEMFRLKSCKLLCSSGDAKYL
jgi:hypothetical protein